MNAPTALETSPREGIAQLITWAGVSAREEGTQYEIADPIRAIRTTADKDHDR